MRMARFILQRRWGCLLQGDRVHCSPLAVAVHRHACRLQFTLTPALLPLGEGRDLERRL